MAARVEEPTRKGAQALNSYWTLLSSRSVRRQAASGLIAQLTQGTAAIGIILVVRENAGSLALAGGVSAAVWIAGAIARPLQGRLIDGSRPRAVLAGCGLAHAIALSGIAALSNIGAPGAVLIATGALAGASLPAVSTSMRVEWSKSCGAAQLPAAYSLVYLTQQLAILAGPLILAAVIAAGSPSLALITIAVIAGAGALLYAAALPAPRRSVPVSPRPMPGLLVLRYRALQIILCVALLVGALIGALEVAAPIIAAHHHAPAAAGLLIGCLSVGGILGAALYASRRAHTQAPAFPLVLLLLITAAVAVMSATEGLAVAGVLFLVVGIALNPLLTSLSLLVDGNVPANVAGEAFGWLSTAVAGGGGIASLLAAVAAQQQQSPRGALLVAAAAAVAGLAVTALARRRLSSPPLADPVGPSERAESS